jgi:hypothetical protein
LVLGDAGRDALFRVSRAAAEPAGLGATPLVTTARDTAAWDSERGRPPLAVGFSAAQEEEALEGALA